MRTSNQAEAPPEPSIAERLRPDDWDAKVIFKEGKQMKYCYSTDEEHFHGEFDTKEEAALEAFEDSDVMVAQVGESVSPDEFITPRSVGSWCFEDLCDILSDECGEASENFTLTSDEQIELGAVILMWIKEHGGFHCFAVKNTQTVQRKEVE
jgi:hypothetical protein